MDSVTRTWTCLLCVTPDGEPAFAQRAPFLKTAQAATFDRRDTFVQHVREIHGCTMDELRAATPVSGGFLDGTGWTGRMKTVYLADGRPLVSVLHMTPTRRRGR